MRSACLSLPTVFDNQTRKPDHRRRRWSHHVEMGKHTELLRSWVITIALYPAIPPGT
jgi:hypothetical protein